jgi:hypothetical protein
VALTLIVVEPEPEAPPDRVAPNKLLAAWIDLHPVKPSRRSVGMQAAAAKRICDQYTRAEITAAWEGMALIFPYAPRPVGKGDRWSLTDMERRFHDAAAKAVESHPAVKRAREQVGLQRMRERMKAKGYTDAELG